ncbi:hypothetical protein FSARC_11696 [Fusarium sarcochroum]|uniref:Kinesin light chain n=1 Tax=Fusarium sarcochroum TaxID=1208366 RepID=A0A8H4TDT9_9HYPO|nr:hypothetical protein FSARC_11696 [Fusarium sarcochroum]
MDDESRGWTEANGEETMPTASKRRKVAHTIDDDGRGQKQRLSPSDYTVGWICAISIEMAPARAMLDRVHESLPTSPDDTNAYTFGNIGKHNIVIACLPSGHYGLNNAAIVANNMRRSFHSVRISLMVGIGGGVPGRVTGKPDVRLGDVVVSTEVVQYDFGKTIQQGHFQRTGTLNKPPQALMTAVAKLQADHQSEPSRIPAFLTEMLKRYPSMIGFTHPGSHQDQLFDGTYDHAQELSSCESCDPSRLVSRPARSNNNPRIHCGIIASGNQVMKHGATRDQLAKELNVLCFEMEAAGLMDSLPSLVVRGICDYSDSHKNKQWQEYAAAMAAAYVKELLSIIPMNSINQTQGVTMSSDTVRKHEWMVPFERNEDFVGRQDVLRLLRDRIPPGAKKDICQRTVIEGLGGVGKTQIALEAAYRLRDTDPSCSVFWVPAIDMTTFENAYRNIGRLLDVTGIDDGKADVKTLVQSTLSHEDAGRWLLIIDNADDPELIFGLRGLTYFLPRSMKGSILFTTRTREITERLDVHAAGIIKATKMSREESSEMLQARLIGDQVRDSASTDGLLDFLDDLPLAIRQASAHLFKTGISTTRYLKYCRSSDETLIKLLSRHFEDRGSDEECDDDEAMSVLLLRVAEALRLQGTYGEAVKLNREALKLKVIVFGKENKETFSSLNNLAATLSSVGQDEEAEKIHREVLELRKRVLGEKHQSTLSSMNNLANVLFSTNQYEEAEAIYREVVELMEEVLGKEHSDTLVSILNLSSVVYATGKYEEAEAIGREVGELMEKVLGKEHPFTLSSMHNFALTLEAKGEYQKAEGLYRETLKQRERVLGKEHPETLETMRRLAARFEYRHGTYRRRLVLVLTVVDTLRSCSIEDELHQADRSVNTLRDQLKSFENRQKTHFSATYQRFNGIDQRFVCVDQQFDNVDKQFDGVDTRLESVDQRFDGINERLDSRGQRLDTLEALLIESRADVQRFHAQDQDSRIRNPLQPIHPVIIFNPNKGIIKPDSTLYPKNAAKFYALRSPTTERK